MGGHEVGGQKWAAGEWRGEEGVGVMDEGAVSRTRAQRPGRGHGITHKGALSQTRARWAWRHGQGCGEGCQQHG